MPIHLIHQISPKSVKKCGKYVQNFINERKESMTVTEQNCTTQMFARQLWTPMENFINLKDRRDLYRRRFFLFRKQRLELKSHTVWCEHRTRQPLQLPFQALILCTKCNKHRMLKARTIHVTLQPPMTCAVGNPQHIFRHKVPSSGETFTNFRYCNALTAR